MPHFSHDRLVQLLAINDQLMSELTGVLAASQNDITLAAARRALQAALKIKTIGDGGISALGRNV